MELEYINGVRITKLHHEKSVLDVAISKYEDAAKRHYDLKNKCLKLPKDEREKKLKESLKWLEKERLSLEAVGNAQAALALYRKAGEVAITGKGKDRATAIQMMRSEDHHPTDVLEKHMRAEGVPKPSRHHTAHHILPGSGQYAKPQLIRARIHMHVNGVRINDPANGVYLVTIDKNTPHWSMPGSRGHLKYHTKAYEEWTSQKVTAVRGMDQIKTQLQIIGRLLQQHEPKGAIAKIKGL